MLIDSILEQSVYMYIAHTTAHVAVHSPALEQVSQSCLQEKKYDKILLIFKTKGRARREGGGKGRVGRGEIGEGEEWGEGRVGRGERDGVYQYLCHFSPSSSCCSSLCRV